jgi:hypothetical protein
MKLKHKLAIWAWMFNGLLVLSLYNVLKPEHGYTSADRQLVDNIFASVEYDARAYDIQQNVTPLSLSDLEIK